MFVTICIEQLKRTRCTKIALLFNMHFDDEISTANYSLFVFITAAHFISYLFFNYFFSRASFFDVKVLFFVKYSILFLNLQYSLDFDIKIMIVHLEQVLKHSLSHEFAVIHGLLFYASYLKN